MQFNNFVYIALTAIAVSLDSFFAGFAMGARYGRNWLLPTMTAILTALTCALTSLLAIYLNNLIQSNYLDYIGAGILLCVGIYNLVSARTQKTPNQTSRISQAIIVGFAVALDASIACLSLTVMDFSPYLVTALFALTHFITVALGQIFATAPQAVKILKRIDWLGGAILIVLAIVKIV